MTKTTKDKVKVPDISLASGDPSLRSGQNSVSEPTTMDELMAQYSSGFKLPKRGTFMDGVVTRVTPKEIRIDLGSKIEGIVMDKELELFKDLVNQFKPGDKVNVYVVTAENKQGQLILSVRRYALALKWKKFEEALAENETVTIRGLEINKGGCICQAEGLQGFLPTSQMDSSRTNHLNDLVNRLLKVKVIEVNRAENRLIFSERLVNEEENKEKTAKLREMLEAGKQYEAEVVGIVPFGAFVKVKIDKDVMADGLIHISEISWDKVDDVNKYMKMGDKLKVLVLGIDEKSGKANCSLKQLTEDTWGAIASNFTVDEKVKGLVKRISDYGVFVELEGGIEGLIHISKIPPGKTFEVGETITCVIESVEPSRRKISLIPQIEEKFIGYR
jgi:small subunit ribosomal protein S1